MLHARDWIERLGLMPHPEGGWYAESWRASELVATPRGQRPAGTAIYFLLGQGERSHLHRLAADEIWHFYAGGPLSLHLLQGEADLSLPLGPEALQQRVPAGTWFGAEPDPGSAYSLVGCTMAPGFDFADFELGSKARLLAQYPQQSTLIERLGLR
jgi:predicted cupin superfamily sugar epimerase